MTKDRIRMEQTPVMEPKRPRWRRLLALSVRARDARATIVVRGFVTQTVVTQVACETAEVL